MASLKKQALTLTLANAYTRALGFALRLITARLMGAQALGVMEMSSSAVMLAITPVTAGVPTAVSRLTAQKDADEAAVLRAGLSLVKRMTLLLTPALLLLSPCHCLAAGGHADASLPGDERSADRTAGPLRRIQRMVLWPQ